MEGTGQYFPVVPFIMSYKMVLTFESVYASVTMHSLLNEICTFLFFFHKQRPVFKAPERIFWSYV